MLRSVSSGAAGSWALSNLAPRIVAGDFAPGFFVDHFVKDMGIALDEAARMRIAMPGLALARQLYVALQAQGHGRDGTQALILALAVDVTRPLTMNRRQSAPVVRPASTPVRGGRGQRRRPKLGGAAKKGSNTKSSSTVCPNAMIP